MRSLNALIYIPGSKSTGVAAATAAPAQERTVVIGITAQAILVTSRFDDFALVQTCERHGIRLLPKPMAPYIPIQEQVGGS